ncbi:MAG: glycosyltransferase family 4 protein [Actinomycetia bacterium]|nr:glycosyltransferase family 4 protein [Actinomycetes bacterium]
MIAGSIDQFLAAASPGDAVTTEALVIRNALRRSGPAEVYAEHVHTDLLGDVLPVHSSTPEAAGLDIYHASIGCPAVVARLAESHAPIVVRYHNITPAEFFRPDHAEFADLLDLGRDELRALAPRAALGLGDSRFNTDELIGWGYTNGQVSPLVVDLEQLVGIEPDPDTENHLQVMYDDDFVVLVVGQVLPHKRVDLAVQALDMIATHHNPGVRAIIAGGSPLADYPQAIHRFIIQLGLHTVWATGWVADRQLAAFFRRADVLLLTSQHEGFSVPILEAMAHGVPVVASNHGAIADTAGDAALILDRVATAADFAEGVLEVLGSRHLRDTMIERGQRRAAELSMDRTLPEFFRHIAALAPRALT